MAEQKSAPKRMGRPPKAPEKGRRQNYTFRMSDADRDKVVAAAEASGRSISEEIEKRIEDSFKQPELIEATSRATADAVASATLWLVGGTFGGEAGFFFARRMARALNEALLSAGIENTSYNDLMSDREKSDFIINHLQNAVSEAIPKSNLGTVSEKIMYESFARGVAKPSVD